MTKNRKSLYIALTGRDLRGRTHSTQGVAIGLKYAAPSGCPEKKQVESLIYNSPGYRPGYG
ncbi:hypothetical protein ACFO6W_04300 [Dysgonomonas termitidis]|uniref:Uncharacterized protein n=1 Tax=Dysgonomonas termitidis TaxID=1516126 RepID=A0ABV9KSE6_9BACT